MCNPETVTKENLGNQILKNSKAKGFSKHLCEGLPSTSPLLLSHLLVVVAGTAGARSQWGIGLT